MLTDFYSNWHRVYSDNMQHKRYSFANLTYFLHYLEKYDSLVLSILDIVFSSMWVALQKTGLSVAEMKIPTWR